MSPLTSCRGISCSSVYFTGLRPYKAVCKHSCQNPSDLSRFFTLKWEVSEDHCVNGAVWVGLWLSVWGGSCVLSLLPGSTGSERLVWPVRIVHCVQPAIIRTGVSSLCASNRSLTSPIHALCFWPVFLTADRINCLFRLLSGTLSIICVCGMFIHFWLNFCLFTLSCWQRLSTALMFRVSGTLRITRMFLLRGFKLTWVWTLRLLSPAAVVLTLTPLSHSGNDGFPVADVLVEMCRNLSDGRLSSYTLWWLAVLAL